MQMPALVLPRLPLLIGGGAAALLVGAVVAALLLWAPDEASAGDASAPIVVMPEAGDAPVTAKCPECGVVASAQHIGITGAAASGYAITVRMRDGSQRSFTAAASSKWRAGDRVILIDGAESVGE